MLSEKLVFGTMNAFGTFNGLFRRPISKARSHALLAAVYNAGIRTIDTAPIYCRGIAEERLGEFARDDCEIWTKVGVSIGKVLPTVDFTFDALNCGLRESLVRLDRSSVSIAFLHNADSLPKATIEVDRFANWAKGSGLIRHLGISLFGNRLPERLLKFDELEFVMVESAHLKALIENHGHWLESRRVIVRSVLFGGTLLRGSPIQNRSSIINQVIANNNKLWPVWRHVVAPRTVRQVRDYQHIMNSQNENDHTSNMLSAL